MIVTDRRGSVDSSDFVYLTNTHYTFYSCAVSLKTRPFAPRNIRTVGKSQNSSNKKHFKSKRKRSGPMSRDMDVWYFDFDVNKKLKKKKIFNTRLIVKEMIYMASRIKIGSRIVGTIIRTGKDTVTLLLWQDTNWKNGTTKAPRKHHVSSASSRGTRVRDAQLNVFLFYFIFSCVIQPNLK